MQQVLDYFVYRALQQQVKNLIKFQEAEEVVINKFKKCDYLPTLWKELNITCLWENFINEKPLALYETTNPNLILTINLGYELMTISSPESAVLMLEMIDKSNIATTQP